NGKRRSAARLAVHRYFTAVGLRDVLDQRKPDPGSPDISSAGSLGPVESIEDAPLLLARNARTAVGDRPLDHSPLAAHLYSHGSGARIFDRILEQVEQGERHGVLVEVHPRELRFDGELQVDALALQAKAVDVERPLDHVGEVAGRKIVR